MAKIEDGVALLSSKTTTVAGFIILSVSETRTSEEIVVDSEDGDPIVHLNGFGERFDVEIECIPKSGTAVPATGDTFTYTSETHGASKKIIITELSAVSVNKDVTKWTIKGPRFAGIAIT